MKVAQIKFRNIKGTKGKNILIVPIIYMINLSINIHFIANSDFFSI